MHNLFKKKKTPKTYSYGSVNGVKVGDIFATRKICSDIGLHGPTQAGIHGNVVYGAYSVVLSGGYEDDEDHGDRFWYTGEGGRDSTGAQVEDQKWENKSNKSLKNSCNKLPIRVIRGYTLESPYAPDRGYRYDGLYKVTKVTRVRGKSGFLLCKYLFQRKPDQPPLPEPRMKSKPLCQSKLSEDKMSKGHRSSSPDSGKYSTRIQPYASTSKVQAYESEAEETQDGGLFGSENEQEGEQEEREALHEESSQAPILGKRKRILTPISLEDSDDNDLPSRPYVVKRSRSVSGVEADKENSDDDSRPSKRPKQTMPTVVHPDSTGSGPPESDEDVISLFSDDDDRKSKPAYPRVNREFTVRKVLPLEPVSLPKVDKTSGTTTHVPSPSPPPPLQVQTPSLSAQVLANDASSPMVPESTFPDESPVPLTLQSQPVAISQPSNAPAPSGALPVPAVSTESPPSKSPPQPAHSSTPVPPISTVPPALALLPSDTHSVSSTTGSLPATFSSPSQHQPQSTLVLASTVARVLAAAHLSLAGNPSFASSINQALTANPAFASSVIRAFAANPALATNPASALRVAQALASSALNLNSNPPQSSSAHVATSVRAPKPLPSNANGSGSGSIPATSAPLSIVNANVVDIHTARNGSLPIPILTPPIPATDMTHLVGHNPVPVPAPAAGLIDAARHDPAPTPIIAAPKPTPAPVSSTSTAVHIPAFTPSPSPAAPTLSSSIAAPVPISTATATATTPTPIYSTFAVLHRPNQVPPYIPTQAKFDWGPLLRDLEDIRNDEIAEIERSKRSGGRTEGKPRQGGG